MRIVSVFLLAQTMSVAFAGVDSETISNNVTSEFKGNATSTVKNRVSDESIIGVDNRSTVTSTEWPARTIGRFDKIGCTGTLVGPRHVLTAGHCLFDTTTKKWTENLDFVPAYNINDAVQQPYGKIAWEKAYAMKAYTEQNNSDYDFGMVILREPVGTKAGWVGFGYDDNMAVGTPIWIIGYPGDKPVGTVTMDKSGCKITSLAAMRLQHDCDTYGGNSGSAILILSAQTIFAKGVHTNGGDINSGVRINKAIFDQLVLWKNAHQ